MDRNACFGPRYWRILRALVASALLFLVPSLAAGEAVDPLACPLTSRTEALPGSLLSSPQQLVIQESYFSLPLHFTENRGQMESKVKYLTKSPGQAICFTREGVISYHYQKRTKAPPRNTANKDIKSPITGCAGKAPPGQAVVKLLPWKMSPEVKLVGVDPQQGKINYFIGNDRRKWHPDIPTYGAVLYHEAYPGIDLKFYGTGRKLEYDIIVKPQGDPGKVKFQYQGIKGLKVTEKGELAITLPDDTLLLQRQPVVYQEISGQQVAREGRFQLHRDLGPGVYGFAVAAYDRRYPLVIDPVIVYSTYLGGSDYDVCYGIAVDRSGCAYVTGQTYSTDFPGNSAGAANKGGSDVFVSKINAAGNVLLYSTYVGGGNDDAGYALAVDQDGNACVTGVTYSEDFPTKNAFQASLKGAPDAFIFKLNAQGNDLIYASLLGGTADEEAYAITLDSNGSAYVTGYTGSDDFPTMTPFQLHLAGFYNAFVTKVSAAGALVYSTYLGGSLDDQGNGIAADKDGNAYVTGYASSTDFPTQSPWQQNLQGNHNAFATKIAPGGNALVYSTYLGGGADDEGYAIAVDQEGNAYLAGYASSTDFPTRNPLQAAISGEADAFVTELNAAGTDLVFSTYLGGSSSEDFAGAIAVDLAGNIYLTGWTASADFPLKAPWQSQLNGLFNGFVAKIGAAGRALVYSSYLGGAGIDQAYGIALDPQGSVYLAGGTDAHDFPTMNPLQASLNGTDDGFITKIREGWALGGALELLLLDED